MTRDEAVKLLQATRLMLMDGANQPISDLYYALDMAIEALEQTEPQTKCYLRTSCDHYGDKQVCGRCREYNLYSHTKTEPQTMSTPYSIDTSSICKIESQTEYKMPYEDCEDCETHLKAQYGSSW